MRFVGWLFVAVEGAAMIVAIMRDVEKPSERLVTVLFHLSLMCYLICTLI